jgi:hypothetical protein
LKRSQIEQQSYERGMEARVYAHKIVESANW